MNLNRLTLPFLVLCLGSTLPLSARQIADERREFEATKAGAEKGDAQAQLSLGLLYASGTGVAKDLGKAVKWHRKAAEQGLARAQFVLATEYAEGAGVKPNRTEAAKWFRRAAEQNLPEAQFALGKCYANGTGVSPDPVEAVKWYKRAANQNYVEAIAEVGECFLQGTGVATDIVEGVKWIRKAAEEGYAPAQNRFGLCYLKGEGVDKDFVQAYKWFNLSAAQGGPEAADVKVNLARAQSNMTPEQIAEAQRLAREFRPQTPSNETGIGQDPASVGAGNLTGGVIKVTAEADTCEVFVDGSFVGNPPAKLHLAEGSHIIEVKKAGFKDYRKEIHVSNGAELTLHATLEKQ